MNRSALSFVALLLFTPSISSAALLGSVSGYRSVNYFPGSGNTTLSALVSIGPLVDLCYNVGTCAQVALLENIDGSANGTTLTIDASSSLFSPIVSRLTDSALDYIHASLVAGPVFGSSGGGAYLFPAPDFAGMSITSIVLSIGEVTFTPTTVSGITFEEFRYSFTLDVYGTNDPAPVPEPATWISAAVGCAAIAAKRRLRR